MKQRLMTKNTIELVWWVVVLIASGYSLSTSDWPADALRIAMSFVAFLVSTWRISDHWQRV